MVKKTVKNNENCEKQRERKKLQMVEKTRWKTVKNCVKVEHCKKEKKKEKKGGFTPGGGGGGIEREGGGKWDSWNLIMWSQG